MMHTSSSRLRATALISLVVMGCQTEQSDSLTVNVAAGEFIYAVPAEFVREERVPQWLKRLVGVDDGRRELLLEFPASVIAGRVLGYSRQDGDFVEDISAVLAVINDEEINRYLRGDFERQVWHLTGSFADAVIEELPVSGWYRVFRGIEYPYSWAVTRLHPSPSEAMPDPSQFFVAHCLRRTSVLTKSGNRIACVSHVVVNNVVIEFEFSEQSLPLVDEISEQLKLFVEEWGRATGRGVD